MSASASAVESGGCLGRVNVTSKTETLSNASERARPAHHEHAHGYGLHENGSGHPAKKSQNSDSYDRRVVPHMVMMASHGKHPK